MTTLSLAFLAISLVPIPDGAADKETDIQCSATGEYIGGINRTYSLHITNPKDKKWKYQFSVDRLKGSMQMAGTYELEGDLAVFKGQTDQKVEVCFALNYGFPRIPPDREGEVYFDRFFPAADQTLRYHRKW